MLPHRIPHRTDCVGKQCIVAIHDQDPLTLSMPHTCIDCRMLSAIALKQVPNGKHL